MWIFGEFFLPQKYMKLKIWWTKGYRDQHLFYNFLKFIIDNFYFIIELAQKYQFFVISPTRATALDFMDPRFLIYTTSAFQW